MATPLSNLVDNLTVETHKTKCKDSKCFLEYESFTDHLIKNKCLSCNKYYANKIYEELKKRFKNTIKLSNNVINQFVFLLRKSVYPYEYMDEQKKFYETTLPENKEIYGNINMEYITNVHHTHTKRVCKDFEVKHLDEVMIYILKTTHYFQLMFSKVPKKIV